MSTTWFKPDDDLQELTQDRTFMRWMQRQVTAQRMVFDGENRSKGNENRNTAVEVLADLETAVAEAQQIVKTKGDGQ